MLSATRMQRDVSYALFLDKVPVFRVCAPQPSFLRRQLILLTTQVTLSQIIRHFRAGSRCQIIARCVSEAPSIGTRLANSVDKTNKVFRTVCRADLATETCSAPILIRLEGQLCQLMFPVEVRQSGRSSAVPWLMSC